MALHQSIEDFVDSESQNVTSTSASAAAVGLITGGRIKIVEMMHTSGSSGSDLKPPLSGSRVVGAGTAPVCGSEGPIIAGTNGSLGRSHQSLLTDVTVLSESETDISFSETDEKQLHHRRHDTHKSTGSLAPASSKLSLSQTRPYPKGKYLSEVSLQFHSEMSDVPEEERVTATIIGYYRDRFTTYKVMVQFGNRTWILLRKYNDFTLLNKKLQAIFPRFHFELPQRKTTRSNFTHQFIEERQHALDGYLKTLLTRPDLAESDPVKKFLKLDDPPQPQEDIEATKLYCQELQRQNERLYRQLQNAKMKINALQGKEVKPSSVQDKIPEVPWQSHHQAKIKELQNGLAKSQWKEESTRKELENLKRVMNAEVMGERSARQRIAEKKQTILQQQMEYFDELHTDLHRHLEHLSRSLSEQTDKGKEEGENVEGQIAKLKQAIHDWEGVLRNHHQEVVESFTKEISDLNFDIAKRESSQKVNETEVQLQRQELTQQRDWFERDSQLKNEKFKELTQQLKASQKDCLVAEEQYFYALFIGAKMSISMCKQAQPNLNGVDWQDLYTSVKKKKLPLHQWPRWLGSELRLLKVDDA